MILPTTAEKYGGLCAVCARSKERESKKIIKLPSGRVQTYIASALFIVMFHWVHVLLAIGLLFRKNWTRVLCAIYSGLAVLIVLFVSFLVLIDEHTSIVKVTSIQSEAFGTPVAPWIAAVFYLLCFGIITIFLSSRQTVEWFKSNES